MGNNCTVLPLSQVPSTQAVPFATVFGIISIFASVGNITSLIVFLKCTNMESNSYKFYVSLTISDVIVGLVVAPISSLQMLMGVNCAVNTVYLVFRPLVAITGMTCCIIAFDRYLSITKNIAYPNMMTKYRIIFLILVPWLFPLLLTATKFSSNELHYWFLLFLFILCYCIMITSYQKLKKHLRLRYNQFTENQHMQMMIHAQNVKAVNLVNTINIVFVICTLPLFCYRILMLHNFYTSGSKKWFASMNPTLNAIAQCAFQFNSCLNPILYFRKVNEFVLLWRRLTRRRNRVGVLRIGSEVSRNKERRSTRSSAITKSSPSKEAPNNSTADSANQSRQRKNAFVFYTVNTVS